jgi:hypothetical protein
MVLTPVSTMVTDLCFVTRRTVYMFRGKILLPSSGKVISTLYVCYLNVMFQFETVRHSL